MMRRTILFPFLFLVLSVLLSGCTTVSEMGCMRLKPAVIDDNALFADLKNCSNSTDVATFMACPPNGTYSVSNDVTWSIWCYCKHTVETGPLRKLYIPEPRVVYCKFCDDKLIGIGFREGTNTCCVSGDIVQSDMCATESLRVLRPIYEAAYNNDHGLSLYFNPTNNYYCAFESGREVDHWEGSKVYFKPLYLSATNGYKRVSAIDENGQTVYCTIPADAKYKGYNNGLFRYEYMTEGNPAIALGMIQSSMQNLNQMSQSYSTPTRTVVTPQATTPTTVTPLKTHHHLNPAALRIVTPRAPSFGWGLDGNATDR